MNQITEQLYAEKVSQLSDQLENHRRIIIALVYELGKGKRVTVSKGNLRQAEQTIESVDARTLSKGELRIDVQQRKEGKNDG